MIDLQNLLLEAITHVNGLLPGQEFEVSDYFVNWIGLLKDENFLKMVNDNNLTICFYVHPKLNRFIESFDDVKNVTFLNSKNGDSVQQHLKEAAIMITDFSSVFFDFAYMRKPAIYFQFDEDKYYESHYIKAYFDYRDNGFGPVAINKEEAISALNEIVKNNMNMQNKYLKRAEEFFPLYDEKNCERIYNSILEAIKK